MLGFVTQVTSAGCAETGRHLPTQTVRGSNRIRQSRGDGSRHSCPASDHLHGWFLDVENTTQKWGMYPQWMYSQPWTLGTLFSDRPTAEGASNSWETTATRRRGTKMVCRYAEVSIPQITKPLFDSTSVLTSNILKHLVVKCHPKSPGILMILSLYCDATNTYGNKQRI